ncbi:MAG: hypothetical protein H7A51_15075 [Akkermansiaceae bacterium]|nr:hypothetical protein [Akkermansiaceae bacterium]
MPTRIKDTPPRRKDGTYPPGTSGNPSGRPKSANAELRQRLAKDGEKIIQAVIDQAMEGDMTAAKIILDRILPPLRPTVAPVTVPLPHGASQTDTAQAILTAAAQGYIPADTAAQLITATANLTRIIELEEIKPRLEALERALKKQ